MTAVLDLGSGETPRTLVPRWVASSKDATKAARSEDTKSVWIIQESNLADWVAHEAANFRSFKKTGYVVLILDARSALLQPLEKRFKAVACTPSALPKKELDEVLKLQDRKARFIGGIADRYSRTLTLWRGNFASLVVPFEAFPATANGIRPDFKQFAVTDYGKTVKLGDYESDADAVLYEFAPDFRKEFKQARFREEQSLGASIRRLRVQRRLRLKDFGAVDAKTLGRIERGEVRTPRPSTLMQIAKKLRVSKDELGSF